MAHINLLPWREEQRRRQQKDFLNMLVAAALVGVLIVIGAQLVLNMHIDAQQKRNQYLTAEIKKMDIKIREIRSLEKVKAQLIARMNIIQQLQASRPRVVHMMDATTKVIPDGVHLSSFRQTGNRLAYVGRAQSNARISSFMRNVEGARWLMLPKLGFIQNKDRSSTGLNDFNMTALLRNKPAKVKKR